MLVDNRIGKHHRSPIVKETIINSILRIATEHTSDTNQNIIHTGTKIVPLKQHTQLHASKCSLTTTHPEHQLHNLHLQPRIIKQTIFNTTNYNIPLYTCPTEHIEKTQIIQQYIHKP